MSFEDKFVYWDMKTTPEKLKQFINDYRNLSASKVNIETTQATIDLLEYCPLTSSNIKVVDISKDNELSIEIDDIEYKLFATEQWIPFIAKYFTGEFHVQGDTVGDEWIVDFLGNNKFDIFVGNDKFIEHYDKILEIDSLNIHALYGKGHFLEYREEYGRALQCYEKISVSDSDYIFIKKFVDHYQEHYEQEDLQNLKSLMTKKGSELSYNEIITLIKRELDIQRYNKFKNLLTHNNPISLEDYIKNLIEAYGDNYNDFLRFFMWLIHENGMNYNKSKILAEIDEMKETIKLEEFERKLQYNDSNVLSLGHVDSLEGHEFERFLKVLFKKMGYIVKKTPLSKDQGADLIISKFGHKTVVQAKRWGGKVTNKAVQEITAAISHYNADEGMVITNSEFTHSAVELANSNNVILIDREKLENLIKKHPISKKEFESKI